MLTKQDGTLFVLHFTLIINVWKCLSHLSKHSFHYNHYTLHQPGRTLVWNVDDWSFDCLILQANNFLIVVVTVHHIKMKVLNSYFKCFPCKIYLYTNIFSIGLRLIWRKYTKCSNAQSSTAWSTISNNGGNFYFPYI